ncbi:MAG: DRTGG domain-containing protein [Smithella sp.]
MDKFVITSMRQSAGKTSLIIGLAKVLNKKIGYLKPFGARLVYKKKRLWDYDVALLTNIFNFEENPEDMSVGFYHSQLLYSLDEKTTAEKLRDSVDRISVNKDIIFLEAGKDLFYGTSIYLDAINVARIVEGKLLILVSGDEDTIIDDISFLAKYIRLKNLDFLGVVINKVANLEDFNNIYLPRILQMGVPVLGIIPVVPELTYFTAGYLAERMFAKVLAGESGLNRQIRNIVVGSMGTDVAMKSPLFQEQHQVLIASGDRSDLILTSLENNAAAVILSNNIVPSSFILSKAENMGIPLLLVPTNTYETAKQIDKIEPLPTKDDTGKIAIIEKITRDYMDLKIFNK